MKCVALILVVVFTAGLCSASIPEDSARSQASARRLLFHSPYLALQYAGNIGFLSFGVGHTARKDKYQLSLVYGYAPPSMAGVRIHTVTAKNIFPLYRFYLDKKQTLIPYGAIGVSLELGGRSFFRQPSIMSDSYYDFPKSIHLIPAAGFKLRHITDHQRNFRGYEFFLEVTSVDVYVWYKLTSDEIRIRQILSLAAGCHFLIK
jgi:hypothetical protein